MTAPETASMIVPAMRETLRSLSPLLMKPQTMDTGVPTGSSSGSKTKGTRRHRN
jgi:hypothetical protein